MAASLPLLALLSPAHARGSGVVISLSMPFLCVPRHGRANSMRRARPGLRTYPSAVTRGAVCVESLIADSVFPAMGLSRSLVARRSSYASRRRAFDDGALGLQHLVEQFVDKAARGLPRLTKGSVKERTSVTHAARDRTSRQGLPAIARPPIRPKCNGKSPPSALSIAE